MNTASSAKNLFSLSVVQSTSSTKIVMQLLQTPISTSNMSFISTLLEQQLPTVLLTECDNDEHLPFAVEVKKTELGHLFEHILLEYLCQLKMAKGAMRASYSGRTRWNWIKEPRGMFHIRLSCGQKDADILPLALEKTITLMKLILHTNQTQISTPSRYFYFRNGLKNGKHSAGKMNDEK